MKRFLATTLLMVPLWIGVSSANAQAPEATPPAGEATEESSGDPLYGYVGTAFFAALAVFAICKSSRR